MPLSTMKNIFTAIILICITANIAAAQEALKGTVYEKSSNTKLNNVFIRDGNNKLITITDKDGNFSIKAGVGHTITFTSPGYLADTLYLVDLRPKRVEMISQTISLRQVNVTATRLNFNPQAEYPEVYEKSKVYAFSPSTWFSKEGKDARRLKRFFKREEEERYVDNAFSKSYVGNIVPLKGQDLENFLTLYRPSYTYMKNNNQETIVAYINDSYKKFMALPPEKRTLAPLVTP